ncbi:MAG: hypothetical protein NZ898_13350 [Myxococcota bacterium]|nr:hypothetical protein [Myxococcota bacterium]MDW8363269.1 hypothetical protein [Myxococcales bacterium]
MRGRGRIDEHVARRLVLAALLGTMAGGCGGGDSGSTRRDAGLDAPADATDTDGDLDAPSPDAARDASGGDAGPPPYDAGMAPPCESEPRYVRFARGFDGQRDADPEDFASFGPAGPWAFAYRRQEGTGASRQLAVEIRIADFEAPERAVVPLDEVRGLAERLTRVAIRRVGTALFAAWSWERGRDDGTGILEAEIRGAAIADDGDVLRATGVLFEGSVAPVLETAPPDAAYLMHGELDIRGDFVGVRPLLQRLDPAGAPLGTPVDLTVALRVEATELWLRAATDGLVLAYRVPPATAFVQPITSLPNLDGPARPVPGVPQLDDVAVRPESIALAWRESSRGRARVGVIVTDRRGVPFGRVELEDFETTAASSVAVVAAWPGYVVLWRKGAGDGARLRAAGLDPYGRLLVAPLDWLSTPHAGGRLFAIPAAGFIVIGTRAAGPGFRELALGRACVPR